MKQTTGRKRWVRIPIGAAALICVDGWGMQARAAGLENQWMFAAGGSSSLVLGPENYLHAWGNNGSGQLGVGDSSNRSAPTTLYSPPTNRTADVSKTHAATIQDGHFVTWGQNNYGQLGDGTTQSTNVIGYYSPDGDWVSICVGTDHTVGLKGDGDVYTWGRNNVGQLGSSASSSAISTTPQRIGMYAIKAISCGDDYTMALRTDGTLWGWGYNGQGNLGDNSTTNRFSPVQVGTSNGTSSGWVTVSAGSTHTVGLRDGGRLYTWGNNGNGQLGDNTTNQSRAPKSINLAGVVEVAAGGSHTLAVTASGDLWAWGANGAGQLGDGTTTQRPTPTAIFQPGQTSSDHNWLAVQAGDNHSLGIRVSGAVASWGSNASGQLGRSTSSTPASKPGAVVGSMRLGAQALGSDKTFLIKSNGTLWAWGNPAQGGLGIQGTFNNTLPTQVTTTSPSDASNNWVKLAHAAGGVMAGIKAGGSLWTWGHEIGGELGNGNGTTDTFNVPSRIGAATDTWKDVDCSMTHCVGLKSNGTLWSWGTTYHGNSSSRTTVTAPTQVGTRTDWIAASAGSGFTAGVRSNGSLWLWGKNDQGQLGIVNDYTDRALPTQMTQISYAWRDVDCGAGHVLAWAETGDLATWGNNDGSQLLSAGTPASSTVVWVSGGTLPWRQFTAHNYNSTALDVGDNLYVWGESTNGEIGDGTVRGTRPYLTLVETARCGYAGGWHSASLDNFIYGWGLNQAGEVGDGTGTLQSYPAYVTTP